MTNIFKYAAKDEKISEKLVSLVIENFNRFNHEDEYIYNYFTVILMIFRLCTVYSQLKKTIILG